MASRIIAVLLSLSLVPSLAAAVDISLVTEETPYTGVTYRHYTTTNPTTHTWVALIDLCTDYVHVDATRAPSAFATTGAWASGQGAQVATNGDFYQSGPRVYGNAVGRGLDWPVGQTGDDPGISWEWFYEKYGWIAFGHDWVDFTHSEWVKNNAATFGGLNEGWMNGTVAPPAPPGTVALVSGFPMLVIEGQVYTCASPTDASCFPDRTDMRSRHPRTAMGLSADRQTFILAVVDGRTGTSSGMYGAELADLMGQLGAHVAFNLDGGGSSQMWLEDRGYVNDYDGNNNGNGLRSMANHWGIFAGGASNKPQRPGHCVSLPACEVIPPAGATVDDSSSCFQTWGPSAFWREETLGYGGHLFWTNAWTTPLASNWAWWQLDFQEGGEYLVEYYAVPAFAIYTATPYVVLAEGIETPLIIDQSAGSGWQALGVFDFAAGGVQHVAVYDDAPGAVAADQHIIADALRVTRTDPWCGNGACDGTEACDACVTDCGVCPFCGDGDCNGAETCNDCAADCGACPPVCGDGDCNGAETCADCETDCGFCPPNCGDGDCNGTETCTNCEGDCGVCPPTCGDGDCNGTETCVDCETDCGVCPPDCGDGTCDGIETCTNCEADCGACAPVCGDGDCNGDETCATCEADCDPCGDPVCGDTDCATGESCASCPADCGVCPQVVCGDTRCSDGEDCNTCPDDCGQCETRKDPGAPASGCGCNGSPPATGLWTLLLMLGLLGSRSGIFRNRWR